MNFDIGTFIAIAAVLLFYLRLILLQRQKGKSASSIPLSNPKKNKKRGPAERGFTASETPRQALGFVIANGYLVGAGVVLILLGVALNLVTAFPPSVRGLWWLAVTLGVLLMGLGIR